MSDPAPSPRAAQPPAAALPRRPVRWLDRLSALLLCLAAGAAMAAATPPLLRAAGAGEVMPALTMGLRQAEPGSAPYPAPPRPEIAHGRAPPVPPSRTRASDDHVIFAPDDDDPRLTELEHMYPDGMWPGQHPAEPRSSAGSATNARVGHALAPLGVHERPDAAASIAGWVPAGGKVIVVREAGTWALVAAQGLDGGIHGWVPRGAITVP
jgi:hypothetical protein